jgi:hypothetical protein
MNLELLFRISDKVRARARLTPEEKRFVAVTLPAELAAFPRVEWPGRVSHPAGFTIRGAVVRTFAKCALVVAARGALGARFVERSSFYERVESVLSLGIMRAHFHHGDPKGMFCCPPCTLAAFTVLEAGALRWIDGRKLAPSVRGLIESRQWKFTRFRNPAMLEWALNGPASKARAAHAAAPSRLNPSQSPNRRDASSPR